MSFSVTVAASVYAPTSPRGFTALPRLARLKLAPNSTRARWSTNERPVAVPAPLSLALPKPGTGTDPLASNAPVDVTCSTSASPLHAAAAFCSCTDRGPSGNVSVPFIFHFAPSTSVWSCASPRTSDAGASSVSSPAAATLPLPATVGLGGADVRSDGALTLGDAA